MFTSAAWNCRSSPSALEERNRNLLWELQGQRWVEWGKNKKIQTRKKEGKKGKQRTQEEILIQKFHFYSPQLQPCPGPLLACWCRDLSFFCSFSGSHWCAQAAQYERIPASILLPGLQLPVKLDPSHTCSGVSSIQECAGSAQLSSKFLIKALTQSSQKSLEDVHWCQDSLGFVTVGSGRLGRETISRSKEMKRLKPIPPNSCGFCDAKPGSALLPTPLALFEIFT